MVQFLNTAKTYSEIESIVTQAENRLVLVSPYIQMPELLLERLSYASAKRHVNIIVVCRKDSLKRNELKALNRISRLDILDLSNLHAKCFYNEKSMVITSLNLYEYSQKNNREMGLLLTIEGDREAFLEAVEEARFIIQMARTIKVNKILAKENGKQGGVANVLQADVGDSLKRAFPTFSKLFGSK